MSTNKTQSASQGVGFFGLLGVMFIGLKLCGIIDWSWFYVLMPLWFGPALLLLTLVGIGLVLLLWDGFDNANRLLHRLFDWYLRGNRKT
jgi:hypothetical protein